MSISNHSVCARRQAPKKTLMNRIIFLPFHVVRTYTIPQQREPFIIGGSLVVLYGNNKGIFSITIIVNFQYKGTL